MARNDVSKADRMLIMSKAIACMDDERGYRETKRNLEKENFKYLGGGAFGSAWAHDDIPGWCIKLASGTDNYPAFVYWAMANPNRHLPDFQFPTFDGQRQQFMVMLQTMISGDDYDDYRVASERCYQMAYEGKYEHCDTELQQVCQNMGRFFGDKVSYDMHTGNALFDTERKCIVLTDPICGGESESFIAKVTGRTLLPQLTHQMDFNLLGGRTKDQIQREAEQNQRIEQARFPALPRNIIPMDFAEIERLCAEPIVHGRVGFGNPQLQQIPKLHEMHRMLPPGAEVRRNRDPLRMLYVERVIGKDGRLLAKDYFPFDQVHAERAAMGDPLGRAAKWIKDNGITPKQARQIAEFAQDWPDERLQGQQYVMLAHCPTAPMVPFNQNVDPNKEVEIHHWRVPVRVIRVLRDQHKIFNDNAARLGWGGRFAAAAKRELGRFI